jgi:hypothetical protein
MMCPTKRRWQVGLCLLLCLTFIAGNGWLIPARHVALLYPGIAHAAPAITVAEIDRYLESKNSPLAGHGEAFLDSGRRWNVDPRLVVAIAGAETTFGTRMCADYNAWNWFYMDTSRCSPNAFDSWEDGIEQVTRGLKQSHLDRGRTTISAIAETYTATDRETWIGNVTRFYWDELGGDPNDLTFAEPSVPLFQPALPASVDGHFGVGAYLGTTFDQMWFDAIARKVREAGIEWVREELRWDEVGPANGPFIWGKFQAAVQAERNVGLEVLGLLDYGPPEGWDHGSVKYVPSPISALVILQWRDYVYSAAQTFHGDIQYWEIWNEPNLNQFWRPQPNVDDYLALLRAARAAIKQVDPQEKIVLGGPSRVNVSEPPDLISGRDWLEQIYERGGGSDFDIVAIHPYNARPENVAADLQDLADVIARHPEAGSKPIWVTEIGWGVELGEETQAAYLVRTYILSVAMPEVERIAWHALTDGKDGRYGIIDGALNPRPAYRAYQTMTKLLGGATFQRKVERPGSDVHEFRFLKGNQIMAIVWRSQGGDEAKPVVIKDIPSSPARVFSIYGETQGEIPVINGQITTEVTERPIYVLFSAPEARPCPLPPPPISSLQTETNDFDLALAGFFGLLRWYNFTVEGEGRIRVSVDDELIIDTCPEGDRTPNRSASRITLPPECHELQIQYEAAYGRPTLTISAFGSARDVYRDLPPCMATCRLPPPIDSLETERRDLNFTGFFGLFGLYNFATEGEGRVRVSIDDQLIIDTCPALGEDWKPNRYAERIRLDPGCHRVQLQYETAHGPPRLGISRWPESPDFDRVLPPCEQPPPEQPVNTPEQVVRTFFGAMDRLDVAAATETIAPVPGYRQVVEVVLGLYKRVMEGLNWDNDFSQLQYEVLSNDGRSAKVRAWGPVVIRNTQNGSIVSELDDFDVEIPVSNFLVRWYIYIRP